MSMYVKHNFDEHRCDLPLDRWVNDDWRPAMWENGKLVVLNEGSVIGCHVCGSEYKLERDALKAGEAMWVKQT